MPIQRVVPVVHRNIKDVNFREKEEHTKLSSLTTDTKVLIPSHSVPEVNFNICDIYT